MAVRIAVSATLEQARALSDDGPRRDFLQLAGLTNGEIVFQSHPAGRGGPWTKLFGPHLRQAWSLARRARRGDQLFADGEHIGLPLLVFLGLLRARPAQTVVLGHLLTRRWKLPLLWLATRLGPPGVLLLHSTAQANAVRRWLSRRWSLRLVPYQVDTIFWAPGTTPAEIEPQSEPGPPLLLAVGSENRDYDTLVHAIRGLDARVVIAAGSHWARRIAGSSGLPANAEYISEPLSFAALRDLYARASAVVVPLDDVPNQSGVTTILEAFSMGVPVVVTATRGQRECVAGPLVTTRSVDVAATADRGPHLFAPEPDHCASCANGMYVPPHDPLALRHALERLLQDANLRSQLSAEGRRTAVQHFSVEGYARRLAAILQPPETHPAGSGRVVPT